MNTRTLYKNILLVCILALTFQINHAQGPGFEDKRERIKSEKIAFLTREMALSPEEAQVFWPVYNDFQSRKDLLNDEKRSINRFFMQNQSNLSEKEAEELGDKLIALQLEEAKLQSDSHKKLKEILPPHKIITLYHAEMKFKNYLLRQLRGGQGRGNHKN